MDPKIEKPQVLSNNDGVITVVNEDDARYQVALEGKICGHCVEFDKDSCQQAMKEQNFVERIVKDEDWSEAWLEPWESYGICQAFSDSQGARIVSDRAPAICAAVDLDSSLSCDSAFGQQKKPCPYYENRKDRGKFATSSAAGVRGPTIRNEEAYEYARRHDARRRQGIKL